MVIIRRFSIVLGIVGGLAGVIGLNGPVQAETLSVAAGHRLKAPFQEILPIFEQEYGVRVHAVYGPSQTLRQQIEKGAPIDVFLPESVEEVQRLHRKGLTLNGGPRIYTQTSLVLVMSTASQATAVSFHDALPNRRIRIAVADHQTSALGEITDSAITTLDA